MRLSKHSFSYEEIPYSNAFFKYRFYFVMKYKSGELCFDGYNQ